jgi:hypothetical protein
MERASGIARRWAVCVRHSAWNAMALRITGLAKKNLTKGSTVAYKGIPDKAKLMPDNCRHPSDVFP